jgi:hypothetical protein
MSDTMILVRWLQFVTSLHRTMLAEESHRPILEAINFGCTSTLKFFKILYDGSLWFDRETARDIYYHGNAMLKAYQWMAKKSLELDKPLFAMVPKLHGWHHILINIRMQLDNPECMFVLSPLVWSCAMDEDFVGIISRISRRVSIRTCELRTLQRYLVACRHHDIKARL